MNIQPNYNPCFLSRQPQKAISENNQVTDSLQTIIVAPYMGSNRYRVGIYTSDSYLGFMAEVIAPDGQQQIVPPSKIVNALNGEPIDPEIIWGIEENASGSCFRAIFLAETGKVSLWPHMQAAGQGGHVNGYLSTDNTNNPCLNKSIERCIADIHSGRFKVPGTNFVVNTGGGGNTNYEKSRSKLPLDHQNYREQHKFASKNGELRIIVMGTGHSEPAHVEVIYQNVKDNGKYDCVKFPLAREQTRTEETIVRYMSRADSFFSRMAKEMRLSEDAYPPPGVMLAYMKEHAKE